MLSRQGSWVPAMPDMERTTGVGRWSETVGIQANLGRLTGYDRLQGGIRKRMVALLDRVTVDCLRTAFHSLGKDAAAVWMAARGNGIRRGWRNAW